MKNHASLYLLGLGLFMSSFLPSLTLATDIETQATSVATNVGLFGGQPSSIVVDALNSANVYIVTNNPGGVFSSNDSGATWAGLPSDSNYGVAKDITVDDVTGDVFAIVGDSLLLSEDQGANWQDITTNLGEATPDNEIFFGNNRLLVTITNSTNQLAVSADGGKTFTTSTMLADYTVRSLDMVTTDTYVAVMQKDTNDSEELLTSVDGGAIWTNLDVKSHGVPTDSRFYRVAADPNNSLHLAITSIVGEYPGYQTFDGGATWTSLTVNGGCIMFDSTSRLYVGSKYTDDASAAIPTWQQINTNTPLSQIYADTCAVDPTDNTILYTNTVFGVAKSIDSGSNWTDQVTGITSVNSYDIAQSADKDTVWIAANGGLAKTTNFTDETPTWQYPIEAIAGQSIYSVWVDPADANHVVVAASATMSYTTDGGTTWVGANTPHYVGTVQSIVASRVDANTLYTEYHYDDLAGDDTGGVFMSSDGGVTWTDLNFTDNLPATAIAVAADDTLYVGVGGDASSPTIYRHNSSGWTALTGGPAGAPITSIAIDQTDDNRLFVTIDDDTTGGLFLTEDAGTTWSETATGLENIKHLNTITAQTSTTPTTYYLVGQDQSSLNGVIYKSSDAGASWNLYYTGLKQESFHTLLFDGLMLGNDRGVFDIKSRATISMLKHHRLNGKITYRVSLKDTATEKKLKHKKISVLVKSNGTWESLKKVQTNKQGKATFTVKKATVSKFKLRWKPTGSDINEYTTATTKNYSVK